MHQLTSLPILPEATRGFVPREPSRLFSKTLHKNPLVFFNDGPRSISEMPLKMRDYPLKTAIDMLERFKDQHPKLVIDSYR